MDPLVLSGLISGGAGLIGSLFNVGSQISTNEANRQLAAENRQFYYEQWQRENAYNDPSAVMQRMARAGLNPALMYGEGAGGLASSASMSPTGQPTMVAPQVDPYMAAHIGKTVAETANIKKDTEKKESEIDVNKGIVRVNNSVVLYNEALTSMTKSQQDKVIAETKALGTTVELANSEIAKNYQAIENMKADAYYKSVELSLKSKEIDALCDKYAAETGWTKEQTKYAGLLAMAKIRNLNADAALKSAQVELTEAEKKQVEQATENLSVVNNQLNWNLQMDKKYGDTDRSIAQSKAISEVVSNLVSDAPTIHDASKRRVDMFDSQNKKLPMVYPQ